MQTVMTVYGLRELSDDDAKAYNDFTGTIDAVNRKITEYEDELQSCGSARRQELDDEITKGHAIVEALDDERWQICGGEW